MSTIEQPNDRFVRIKDGVIVEPFVLRNHIKNRRHPLHWYTRVVETPVPQVDAYHYVTSEPIITLDGRVVIEHNVVAKSLDQVLRDLAIPANDPMDPMAQPTPPNIQDMDPQVVQKIYLLLGDHFHAKLDAFAQTRGYASLTTLLHYKGSAIPSFAAEAARGEQLRDEVWGVLLSVFDEVVKGERPVPISLAEVEDLIPEFTWEPSETPEEPETP